MTVSASGIGGKGSGPSSGLAVCDVADLLSHRRPDDLGAPASENKQVVTCSVALAASNGEGLRPGRRNPHIDG